MPMNHLPRSLSAKLIMAGGGAVAVILIGTTVFTAWETRGRVEAAVLAQADAQAQGISSAIATRLADASSSANTMTGVLTAAYGAGLRDRATVIAMLKSNAERYPDAFSSWFVERPAAFDGTADPKALGANDKGVFTPYWTKPTGAAVILTSCNASYEQSWYKLASASAKGAITEPFLSSQGVLMSTVAYPVLSGGKEIGVAGMDLRLETLSALLGAMKPFGSGRVMLVSAGGNWVANPEAKLLTKHYGDEGAAELTESLGDGRTRILRGLLGGTVARVILPFQVPGLNATWATVMDVPEATFSTMINHEVQISIVIGLGMLLAVLSALLVATRLILRKPMAVLLSSVETLGGGDYDTAVANQESQDEAGALARALEGFRHALAQGRRNEELVATERQKADRLQGETEARQAAVTAEQGHVVSSLAEGLAQLSSGDLACHLKAPFAPDYEALRSDFNAAVDALAAVLRGVAEATAAIRSGSGEISTAADDLSRRTEQQASSLEETAAALDEITATVKKTAACARHAREVVSNAKADAERSSDVVHRAVTAMGSIEASAQQVSQIIGVIDEIAFQTNLLALNAGVEAARAGEAGRGFAVVASEVRALAQRSAEAAKEIKALISTSAAQVGEGVALVGETGVSLGRIAAQVTEINAIVAEIAASAQEQSTGLDQVNIAVNQMDQVTQQNAAMVEQSTAASHGLTKETVELTRLVGRFQFGQERAGGRHVASPPSRPVERVRTLSALKTTGRGGAVPRSSASMATESWEEF